MSTSAPLTLRQVYARPNPDWGRCGLCGGPVGEPGWAKYCGPCLSRCAACGSADIAPRPLLGPNACAACNNADRMARCGDCGDYTDRCKCCVFLRIDWAQSRGAYCTGCGGQNGAMPGVVGCTCKLLY